MRAKTAVAGMGATPYYFRGTSHPQTMTELLGKAIIAAVDDAGLSMRDIDGFAYYSHGADTPYLMEMLGIPEIGYSACVTSGGGGMAGMVGLASSAIVSGMAKVVVCAHGLQQGRQRYGSVMSTIPPSPEGAFLQSAGLIGPGHMFALLARRHMHLYGTTREHFAEVAISSRENARNRPKALRRDPLTLDEYMAAPMIADPLCRYDFCLETDGAAAVIVTSAEHARDLKQPPVSILGSIAGGSRDWGRAIMYMNMPDEVFASSGHSAVARRLYEMAGVGPSDIDVALLYDHFTAMVLMQLEDYGFCGKGESGPFVADGNIRFKGGSIPVNPHGGQLSEAYLVGMTQLLEGIEQIRGTAINQVAGAQTALVTGGPASLPVSGLIFGKE